MTKALVIGTLLFVVILVARAPAALIPGLLPETGPLGLVQPRGTLWNGSAALQRAGSGLGELSWTLQPATLLQARLAYQISLTGPDVELDGRVQAGFERTEADLYGTLDAGPVNDWLRIYNMRLSGRFTLTAIEVKIAARRLVASGGRLAWSGGPVTYILSGKLYNSTLPPLYADLGPGPEAVAYAEGETTPLLVAELKPDGFARVGVTKRLTRILGNPWPGGDPDYKVVLEVEEQVF
jgi:hypothetical protein